jgi:hypothetical protein
MVVLGRNDCIFTLGRRNLLKPNFSVNEEEIKRPIVSTLDGYDGPENGHRRLLEFETEKPGKDKNYEEEPKEDQV